MHTKRPSLLSKKKRYLQVALNSTLGEAVAIIRTLPPSDRIIIEAGTPLIKQYGMQAIRTLHSEWSMRLGTGSIMGTSTNDLANSFGLFGIILKDIATNTRTKNMYDPSPDHASLTPYIAADMKTMDRGRAEVAMAAEAGASAVIGLGSAPTETINAFIDACEEFGVDSMIDMMNVEFPLTVLRALKHPPSVVILHRGVDEERDNRQKMLPLHEIRRVKGGYDLMIAVAGGDTPREVQSAAFNDADIVVIWKSVFENSEQTSELVESFLKTIQ
jgi:bifunctional enzyme Fae/Hps